MSSLSISAQAQSGSFVITPAVNIAQGVTPGALVSIHAITNENTASSPFVQTNLPLLDENDQPNTKFTLGPSVLPLGKITFLTLRYIYSNLTLLSDVQVLTNSSVPQTPVLQSGSVRPEDAGLSINPGQMGYTLTSTSDGFSRITKMIVYISKVGGTLASDFLTREITIPNNVTTYDSWYNVLPMGEVSLTNGASYEVAAVAVNSIGLSPISNTSTIIPADVPSQQIAPRAFSLIDHNNRKSLSLIDPLGDIIVYFKKPSDYDNLLNLIIPKRVTKYVLYEQEMVYNNLGVLVQSGSPVATNLTVPSHLQGQPSGADFELLTTENIDSETYHYKYTIPGDANRRGKIYTYTIQAENENGLSPISNSSNNVSSYANPDLQPFSIVHETATVSTVGPPVTSHTGNLILRISSLSNLNGTKDKIVEESISGVTPGPNAVTKKFNRILKLKVETDTSTPTLIFNNSVTFVHKHESSTTTTGGVSTTTATLFDEWNLDLNLVDADAVANLQSITSKLELGTRYRFTLTRITEDPFNSDLTVSSDENVLTRTAFRSMNKVSYIQAYSLNDDFTPVTTSGGAPGIRVVFQQLLNTDFNGMDAFSTPLEYEVRQGSLPILGISRLVHDSTLTPGAEREFVVPQTIGTSGNFYIRSYKLNPQLNSNVIVEGNESSPQVNEKCISYPLAASSLFISDLTANSFQVNWSKQSTSGLNGNNSADTQNRVVVLNDTNQSQVIPQQIIQHNLSSAPNQSASFTGLVTGNTYRVFVVAESEYTKVNVSGGGNRFDNAITRNNFIETSVVVIGTPSKITNVEVFPSLTNISVNYDEPLSLAGVPLNSLTYNFVLNTDFTGFPYFTDSPQVLAAPIVSITGTTRAILTKTYTSKASSNNVNNAVNLVSGSLHKLAAWATASTGGHNLLTTTSVLTNVSARNINLISSSAVPTRNVVSELYVDTNQYLVGDGVQQPVVSVASDSGNITLFIDKPTSNVPEEMVIIFDAEDGLDSDSNVIPIFDTRDVRDVNNTSGLNRLDTAFNSSPSVGITNPINGIDYSFATGYNFALVTSVVDNVTRYRVRFNKLVNGRIHDIRVRFSRNISGYDVFGDTTILSAAAEAPPTIPRDPTFTVANRTINLFWTVSANTGGALIGINTGIRYNILLFSNSNTNNPIYNVDTVGSETTFTFSHPTHPSIFNGSDYSAKIFAYYLKGNQKVVLTSSADIAQIRPNIPPVGSTGSATAANNQITLSLTSASSLEQTNYPLASISIFIKPSNVSTFGSAFQTINGTFSGFAVISANSLTGLLNGQSYDVMVKHNPNYTYAQAPPDLVFSNLVPFGNPIIQTISPVVGQNRQRSVVVNLNGNSSITNIIALGKSATSSQMGVLNLSQTSGNLPTMQSSGAVSALVAANQLRTFVVDFGASIPAALSDILMVVVTPGGSDSAFDPTTANSFFNPST